MHLICMYLCIKAMLVCYRRKLLWTELCSIFHAASDERLVEAVKRTMTVLSLSLKQSRAKKYSIPGTFLPHSANSMSHYRGCGWLSIFIWGKVALKLPVPNVSISKKEKWWRRQCCDQCAGPLRYNYNTGNRYQRWERIRFKRQTLYRTTERAAWHELSWH